MTSVYLKTANEANANVSKELASALDKIAALEKQIADLTKASPVKAAVPKKGTVVKVKGVNYKVTASSENGGTVTVTGAAKKTAKNVTTADSVTIDGYTFTVNAINKNAFKGCKKLNRITIEAYGISKIGTNAFKGIKKKATIETPSAKVKRLVKKSKGLAKSVKIS